MLSGIAERYASALFELSEEQGAVETVAADLDHFQRLLEASPDLDRLCRNPIFTAEEQTAAVAAVLARAGIAGLAGNFLKLVASKRRLFAARGMIAAFRALVAQKKGIVSAEVTLAVAPSQTTRAAILEAVRAVIAKDVALSEKIDPAIIGGLVVKIGSRMIDASLKTKLNAIKLSMKEVG